uniref:MARVEL domain-containing protein n=1 Tax=Heterorhabditis bacteriophora TaxID=37862 RepID=A0A1I7XR21_HETBA
MKERAARCCGIFHAVMAFTYIFSSSPHNALSATVYAMAVMMAWVAIILLLIGIFCQIPILLVPHMLMQVLFVLTLLAMSSFALYALLVGTSLQLRMTLVDMQVETTPTVFVAPSFKTTLISGFLTGLLILIAIGYFIIAMMNVNREIEGESDDRDERYKIF